MAPTTKLSPITGPIDCACVIHGDAYSWTYVERLYNMLNRHITPGIRLHVYTEADRPVPAPMIKHELIEWNVSGPKKSWWYKMQLFNAQHHSGPLLYFDLDTVIVDNIDWIWQQPTAYFWAVRDFKYLWRPTHTGLNSSIMWWDTHHYRQVWDSFISKDLQDVMKRYHGDQDYLTEVITSTQRRFFDTSRIQSWRWQCLDGGYDFRRKKYQTPGVGTQVTSQTNVMIFHGKPKPENVSDQIIVAHWQ